MATIKTSLFHVISWSIEATCSKDERKIESNRIKVDVRRATPRAMRQKKTCTESDEWNRDQKKARDILLLSHRLHFEQWNWSFAPSLIHYLQYVFFRFTSTLERWHMYSQPKFSCIYILFVRLIFDCCCWLHFFSISIGRLGKYKCIHLLIVDIGISCCQITIANSVPIQVVNLVDVSVFD